MELDRKSDRLSSIFCQQKSKDTVQRQFDGLILHPSLFVSTASGGDVRTDQFDGGWSKYKIPNFWQQFRL